MRLVSLLPDCLIPLFYIKPQLGERALAVCDDCLIPLFYIKPQPVSGGVCVVCHCLIPLFYIKPQLLLHPSYDVSHCLIPLFYIKPQLNRQANVSMLNCLIPLFYIKPQPLFGKGSFLFIVLYLYSTSNHNSFCNLEHHTLIVLYLYSTSNHNYKEVVGMFTELSYTFILHQTTTRSVRSVFSCHCLIPLFYIKPQPPVQSLSTKTIVLYLYSTSNHNNVIGNKRELYIVLYLYSTSNHNPLPCGQVPP